MNFLYAMHIERSVLMSLTTQHFRCEVETRQGISFTFAKFSHNMTKDWEGNRMASLEQAWRDFRYRFALRYMQNDQSWSLHQTITIPLQQCGYLDEQCQITAKGKDFLLQEYQ
ncbi:MAG TPA: hypothetical protein VFK06_15915 [Candidatus Angelobacter sp.]|nr:hypothetical protein [Candidatus Angelobacter sp.]